VNDLSEIGLLRRELHDVRAVAANIDHRTRKLIEPRMIDRWLGSAARPDGAKRNPGGSLARSRSLTASRSPQQR